MGDSQRKYFLHKEKDEVWVWKSIACKKAPLNILDLETR